MLLQKKSQNMSAFQMSIWIQMKNRYIYLWTEIFNTEMENKRDELNT